VTRTWTIALEPQDVLLFKDHRPFNAGDHPDGRLEYPPPSSAWGAMVAGLARAAGLRFGPPGAERPPGIEALMREVAVGAPLPARLPAGGGPPEPYLPRPVMPRAHPLPPGLNLRSWAGRGQKVELREHQAWSPPPKTGARAEPEPPGEPLDWLPLPDFRAWVEGGGFAPSAAAGGEPPRAWPRAGAAGRTPPLSREPRVGIQRDADRRTVEEGMLYLAPRWRLEADHAIAFSLTVDGARAGQVAALRGALLPFGGKGHRARVHVFDGPLLPPAALPGPGPARYLLLSPAVVDAVADPQRGCFERGPPAGGWDFARGGPKPLQRTVARGSWVFADGARVAQTPHGTHHIGALSTLHHGWGDCLLVGGAP
jgi:hypothetical protein